MKIDGAIFDFDGTLFDSMPIWKGIKFKFFDSIGLELSDEEKKTFEGISIPQALALAKERYGIAESDKELFILFFGYMKKLYLEQAEPKNDIIEFLEKLKARGVKMGIATATGEFALIAVLEKYGMRGYFSEIYSTHTVGAAKTEPKVYDVVLEKLGTPKETTWVFEDALYAAKTVKANGYNLVGIFDESEPDTEDLKELSDIYINNYSEIDL